MSRLVLVRHGQASFLAADYDQLSEGGEDQARRLGAYWARHDIQFDRVYVGPRKRHRDTAALAAEACRLGGLAMPEPIELSALDEFEWDKLRTHAAEELAHRHAHIERLYQRFTEAEGEGEKRRTIQKFIEAVTAMWVRGEIESIHIEPWEAFSARVYEAAETMTRQDKRGEQVVAFTSGGPAAVMVQRALHTAPEKTLELIWTLRNGALVEFLYTADRFSLGAFNDAPHLDAPALWTYR